MFSPSGQLYRIDQVPDHFKELFIISGYRSPKSSPSQCLRSIFTATNETFNFWTHFLPAVYFWFRSYELWNSMPSEPYTYPLLAYLFCVCSFPLTSAVAHVFNCLSDEARQVCFFLDYAALSLYSLGAAIAYQAYVFPAEFFGTTFHSLFLPIAVFNAVGSLLISCETRFMVDSYWKKLFRFIAYCVPYWFDCIPVFYRVFTMPFHLLIQDPVMALQLQQFAFAALAAFLYTTHLPERLSPGSFDIIGHSHQLFHICTVLGTNTQMLALVGDLTTRKQFLIDSGFTLSPLASIGLMLMTACLTIIILFFFSNKIYKYKRQGKPIGRVGSVLDLVQQKVANGSSNAFKKLVPTGKKAM